MPSIVLNTLRGNSEKTTARLAGTFDDRISDAHEVLGAARTRAKSATASAARMILALRMGLELVGVEVDLAQVS